MKGKKELDYWNNDYLSLTVKENSVEEIVSSYGAFCWKEIERRADRQYSDVMHVTFTRPHKIENKDKLQFLQVCFEALINERSLINKRKHYKSQMMLSLVLTLGVGVLLGALALVFFLQNTLSIVLGSTLVALEACLTFFLAFKIRKIKIKETKRFNEKSENITKQINKIWAEAICLTGERI